MTFRSSPPPTCLFLDRDGVIIEDVHYLAEPSQVQLIPGVAEAIARVNSLGWPVVVATNQAGVARGYFAESQVSLIHRHLETILGRKSARIDAWYYCPHHPVEGIGAFKVNCTCRKPNPGMLNSAARDLGLSLAHGWMVGDKRTDLEAGARAGCRTMLVRTGYGASEERGLQPDQFNCAGVADALPNAIDAILKITASEL